MEWLGDHWKDVGEIVLQLLGLASIAARLTPTSSDDKIINAIYGVVHKFGLTKPS